jgi:hypothetical protein
MFVRIILLLLVGALSCFAVSEQHVEENFAVTAGAKLIVDVDFGTIDIGHGEDNKIAVSAYRRIEGPSEAQEKEYLSTVPLKIIKEGNIVIVRARPDHHGGSWNWSGQVRTNARYAIRAPSELTAELATGGGGITATELSGSCKAETRGGNLKFIRTRGPLTASSSGGHIALEACDGALNVNTNGGKIDALAGSGSLNAITAGGSILVRNFNGDTKVETSGGTLNLQNIRGKLVGETSGGSISATISTPLSSDVRLETSAGRIEVAVPPDAGLDLNAETNEGCVTSELPVVTKRAGRDGLQGTINGGGKALVLRTGAGNILIKSTNPVP